MQDPGSNSFYRDDYNQAPIQNSRKCIYSERKSWRINLSRTSSLRTDTQGYARGALPAPSSSPSVALYVYSGRQVANKQLRNGGQVIGISGFLEQTGFIVDVKTGSPLFHLPHHVVDVC